MCGERERGEGGRERERERDRGKEKRRERGGERGEGVERAVRQWEIVSKSGQIAFITKRLVDLPCRYMYGAYQKKCPPKNH